MKYHRLTHEQFNEVHDAFAIFLASQGLDHKQWKLLKNENSQMIEELLDLFSDIVWDKIISECRFLEFSLSDQLYLFKTPAEESSVYIVKSLNTNIDLTSAEGFQWVLNHLDSEDLEFLQGTKSYTQSRNEFLYLYLKKGAVPSDGIRYKALESYFSNSTK